MKQILYRRMALPLVLAVMVLAYSCGDPEDGPGGSTEIAMPENLIGTVALSNGRAAVIDFFINSNRSIRAAQNLNARVRYEGEDYLGTVSINTATGQLSGSAENQDEDSVRLGWRFDFSASYKESSGLSGTVQFRQDDDELLASGTVSAAPVADANVGTVKVFTGSFGGGASGVWNGTRSGSRFFGSWSRTDTGEGTKSGSFLMNINGNTLSMVGSSPGGSGTIHENSASGRWTFTESMVIPGHGTYEHVASGTWTGATVDENYDQHTPGNSDEMEYRAGLICQSLENAYNSYLNAFINDEIEMGEDYEGISGNFTAYSDDGYNVLFTLDSYTDTQSSLTLSGSLYVELDAQNTLLRMAADDEINPYIIDQEPDGSGLLVQYPDMTEDTVQANFSIDYTNSYMNGLFVITGNEVVDVVQEIYFGDRGR